MLWTTKAKKYAIYDVSVRVKLRIKWMVRKLHRREEILSQRSVRHYRAVGEDRPDKRGRPSEGLGRARAVERLYNARRSRPQSEEQQLFEQRRRVRDAPEQTTQTWKRPSETLRS